MEYIFKLVEEKKKTLLEIELHKYNKNDVRNYNRDGLNILMYACKCNCYKIVEMLINKYDRDSIDVNNLIHYKNKNNVNVLMVACLYSDIEIVKLIYFMYPKLIDEIDNNGDTVLKYCILSKNNDNIEILKFIIDLKNDLISIINHKNQQTPLMIACTVEENDPKLLELVIDNNNLNNLDNNGLNCLFYIVNQDLDNIDIFKFMWSKMIENDQRILKNIDNENLLMCACKKLHLKIVKFLVDEKIIPLTEKEVNKNGDNILMIICGLKLNNEEDYYKINEIYNKIVIKENKENLLNSVNNQGFNALSLAVKNQEKNLKLIEKLISNSKFDDDFYTFLIKSKLLTNDLGNIKDIMNLFKLSYCQEKQDPLYGYDFDDKNQIPIPLTNRKCLSAESLRRYLAKNNVLKNDIDSDFAFLKNQPGKNEDLFNYFTLITNNNSKCNEILVGSDGEKIPTCDDIVLKSKQIIYGDMPAIVKKCLFFISSILLTFNLTNFSEYIKDHIKKLDKTFFPSENEYNEYIKKVNHQYNEYLKLHKNISMIAQKKGIYWIPSGNPPKMGSELGEIRDSWRTYHLVSFKNWLFGKETLEKTKLKTEIKDDSNRTLESRLSLCFPSADRKETDCITLLGGFFRLKIIQYCNEYIFPETIKPQHYNILGIEEENEEENEEEDDEDEEEYDEDEDEEEYDEEEEEEDEDN